jgi:hypothetical protein
VEAKWGQFYRMELIYSLIHSFLFVLCTNSLPVLRATRTLSGWLSTEWFSTHQTLLSQAKRDTAACMGSRGYALSRGPLPSFLRSRKRGHKALTLHSEFLSLPRCW